MNALAVIGAFTVILLAIFGALVAVLLVVTAFRRARLRRVIRQGRG